GSSPPGYEGGQMPLQRRLPKRGFRPPRRRIVAIVNVEQLEERFNAGQVIDAAALKSAGLMRHADVTLKILGNGTLSKALTVRAQLFSKTARERITAAGGTAEEVRNA